MAASWHATLYALLLFLHVVSADSQVGRSSPVSGCPEKRGVAMRVRLFKKAGRKWPDSDRWQVILSTLSLLVAVVALAEQVGR
ncbi:hypothetical protein ELQ39_14505 [Streptomyces sp. GB4-14]|nr:hypothetical protein [Streptomyces sp. GB4-14]